MKNVFITGQDGYLVAVFKLQKGNEIHCFKRCESYFGQYERDYRSVMPTNLIDPHHNFQPEVYRK